MKHVCWFKLQQQLDRAHSKTRRRAEVGPFEHDRWGRPGWDVSV